MKTLAQPPPLLPSNPSTPLVKRLRVVGRREGVLQVGRLALLSSLAANLNLDSGGPKKHNPEVRIAFERRGRDLNPKKGLGWPKCLAEVSSSSETKFSSFFKSYNVGNIPGRRKFCRGSSWGHVENLENCWICKWAGYFFGYCRKMSATDFFGFLDT